MNISTWLSNVHFKLNVAQIFLAKIYLHAYRFSSQLMKYNSF